MSELKKSSPSLPKEKIAIMAALNIVSDFLRREDEFKDYENVSRDIESIQNTLNLEELE